MAQVEPFLEQLRRDGHVRSPQARLLPLSGGVSSDIYRVEDGTERFVVKRALPKLRVAEDWFADVCRNTSERDYLECVGAFRPDAVPRVRFANSAAGYFGMEYLGDGFTNWKRLLLDGTFDLEPAARAGTVLGEIHGRTAGDAAIRRRFDTTGSFHQLRTAPYLLRTADRHPALKARFVAAAQRLEATHECLVHGDFSPKNILIGGDRLVVLDCEVAWYGDPAFDLAFLLNHLFLKRLYHAPRGEELVHLIGGFWTNYAAARGRLAADFEARVANLLPLLLLARVDGKSPVEYLTPSRAEALREFVLHQIPAPPSEIASLTEAWFSHTRRLPPAPESP